MSIPIIILLRPPVAPSLAFRDVAVISVGRRTQASSQTINTLATNRHRLTLNDNDSAERALWVTLSSSAPEPYLAVEIEQVEGVHAHLDFDL